MDEKRATIEAALFISPVPMSVEQLARLVSLGNIGEVHKIVRGIQKSYEDNSSGVRIYETNGKYGMRVFEPLEGRVAHLAPGSELTQAELKTLALIAYKEPIDKAEVVRIRGNRAYEYLKSLTEKEFLREEVSEKKKVLVTTEKFRKYFNVEYIKKSVGDFSSPAL